MPRPSQFTDKGISKALKELFDKGITGTAEMLNALKAKGITASRSYVHAYIKKLQHRKTMKPKPEKKGIDTAKPSEKPPEMKIEFKPISIPEEIPTAEAVPPTVGEAAIAEGLISDDEMQGMIETINSIPTNPRYQLHEKAIPALAKAWTRVVKKRLTDVEDPNFDIYWAAAITFMAALPPLINYVADRRKAQPKKGVTKVSPSLERKADLAAQEAHEGAPEPTLQSTIYDLK